MKKYGKGILASVAIIFVAVWFAVSLSGLAKGQSREGAQQLETALRRSAVACYAAEGIYPPTVAYLVEHYGIRVEESRYAVFYEVFADNLMPEITVIEK